MATPCTKLKFFKLVKKIANSSSPSKSVTSKRTTTNAGKPEQLNFLPPSDGEEMDVVPPASPTATCSVPLQSSSSTTTCSVSSDDDGTSMRFPNCRIKILCSHGGKIMPRPGDGQLKYVGGDTRVLTLPRSITFAELESKLQKTFKLDVVPTIKYQMATGDLDVLISINSDEELTYMLEEYDSLEALQPNSPSSPRFRLFLYIYPPTTPQSHLAPPIKTSICTSSTATGAVLNRVNSTPDFGGDNSSGTCQLWRRTFSRNEMCGAGSQATVSSSPAAVGGNGKGGCSRYCSLLSSPLARSSSARGT